MAAMINATLYIVSEAKKKSYPLSETCLTYLSYFLYAKIVVRAVSKEEPLAKQYITKFLS